MIYKHCLLTSAPGVLVKESKSNKFSLKKYNLHLKKMTTQVIR
jgi:hypothetical protein